jgi:hypothetical protein
VLDGGVVEGVGVWDDSGWLDSLAVAVAVGVGLTLAACVGVGDGVAVPVGVGEGLAVGEVLVGLGLLALRVPWLSAAAAGRLAAAMARLAPASPPVSSAAATSRPVRVRKVETPVGVRAIGESVMSWPFELLIIGSFRFAGRSVLRRRRRGGRLGSPR